MSALCLFVAGCQQSNPPQVETDPASALPTHAQAKLPTIRLWLGPEEMQAELAISEMEVRTGMMFRTNMDDNAGMLFIFGAPVQASFWMKNCPLPLSAAYIDPDGKILELHDFEAQNTNSVIAATDRVQYVLETSRGYFERKGIKPGTVIRTERGTLHDTFFKQRN